MSHSTEVFDSPKQYNSSRKPNTPKYAFVQPIFKPQIIRTETSQNYKWIFQNFSEIDRWTWQKIDEHREDLNIIILPTMMPVHTSLYLQQEHLLSFPPFAKPKTMLCSTCLCVLSHFLYCFSIHFIGRKTEMKTCCISFKRMMWYWKHLLFQSS